MSAVSSSSSSSSPYKKRVNLSDGMVSFVSGGTAGFLVKSATAPLSRMTILLQIEGSKRARSGIQVFNEITRTEGISSFWKGNWTSIVHKAGATGVNYVMFEYIKGATRPIWRSENNPGFVARTLSGCGAGALSLLVAYPIDIVRTRLACEQRNYHLEFVNSMKGNPGAMNAPIGKREFSSMVNGRAVSSTAGTASTVIKSNLVSDKGSFSHEIRSVFVGRSLSGGAALHAGHDGGVNMTPTSTNIGASSTVKKPAKSMIVKTLRDMWIEEGSRAFTRGLPCTLLCQSLNIGLNFGIYETMNTSFLQVGETRTSLGHTIICGAVAGCTASCMIHPLDLIRRRQQMKLISPSLKKAFTDIIAKEGFKGLYRGLVPELCKVAPAVGLNFYIYEFMRQELFGARINPR